MIRIAICIAVLAAGTANAHACYPDEVLPMPTAETRKGITEFKMRVIDPCARPDGSKFVIAPWPKVKVEAPISTVPKVKTFRVEGPPRGVPDTFK